MRRAVLLASLLLILLAVLGTAAYAGCQTCLEQIVAQRTGSAVTLTIVARSADESFAFPESGNAVVMQVDGNRTKCVAVRLLSKTTEGPGVAVYTGTFSAYGEKTHSGRVDIGGQIYEFTVPLDGRGGTLAVAVDQTPIGNVVRVTATPATPAPTVAPVARDAGIVDALQFATQPVFILGAMVVIVTILGAYVDRRRALARTLAG